jgi:ARG/rhodanese/phosphatase superfamily protein
MLRSGLRSGASIIAVMALAASTLSAGSAAQRPPAPRSQRPAAGRTPLSAHRFLGVPKRHANLTLIPVYDSTAPPTTPFLTLDEALKLKLVQVKEAPGGGQVNTLLVSNLSDRPLYLMAGEVVVGGQQDRSFGSDTLVPPKTEEMPVTVFCVEHGRWNGETQFARGAGGVAGADIRASAQDGAFPGSVSAGEAPAAQAPGAPAGNDGVAGPRAPQAGARPSRVSEAQRKVWDSVEAKNRKFKAKPASGTYREVLDLEGGEARKVVEPYTRALGGSLGSHPHLVGVVVAVNGRIVAADIFGDAGLFRKLWPKLLRSYAADAAENAPAKGRTTPAVTAAQARSFILAATRDASRAENKSKVSTTLRLDSRDATVYRLVPDTKAMGGFGGFGAGAGRAGAPVHESVIRK